MNSVSDDRTDVGKVEKVRVKAVLEYDNTPLDAHDIVQINHVQALWDADAKSFWIPFKLDTVGRMGFLVTKAQQTKHNITVLYDPVGSKSIIWDELEVYDSGATATRCNMGSDQRIWVKLRYEYDDVVFDGAKGSVSIGGKSSTWDTSNDYWYISDSRSTVGENDYVTPFSIVDDTYGLTSLSGQTTKSVIWDRVQVTLATAQDRVEVGTSAPLMWTGAYDYDGVAFNGNLALSEELVKESIGRFNYAVRKISDPLYDLKAFTSNNVDVIFDKIIPDLRVETMIPGDIKPIVKLGINLIALP